MKVTLYIIRGVLSAKKYILFWLAFAGFISNIYTTDGRHKKT